MEKRKVILGLGAMAVVFFAGYAAGKQPHMQAALKALQNAKSELAVAEHNKGGHRDKAAKLVEEAIEQVKKGIAYAAK